MPIWQHSQDFKFQILRGKATGWPLRSPVSVCKMSYCVFHKSNQHCFLPSRRDWTCLTKYCFYPEEQAQLRNHSPCLVSFLPHSPQWCQSALPVFIQIWWLVAPIQARLYSGTIAVIEGLLSSGPPCQLLHIRWVKLLPYSCDLPRSRRSIS